MKIVCHRRPKHHYSSISPDITTFIQQLSKRDPIQIFLNQISKDIHRYEISQKIHEAIINKNITMHNIFVLLAYYKCFNFRTKKPNCKLYLIKHLMQIDATGNQTELNCIIIEILNSQNRWFEQSYLSPYLEYYKPKNLKQHKLNCLSVLAYAANKNHGVLLVSWIQQILDQVNEQITTNQPVDQTENRLLVLFEQLQINSLLQLISIINTKLKNCEQLLNIIISKFGQFVQRQTGEYIGTIICKYQLLEFYNKECQAFTKEMLLAHYIKNYRQLNQVLGDCWRTNSQYPYAQFVKDQNLLNCAVEQIIHHGYSNLLTVIEKILVVQYQKGYREKFHQLQFYLSKNQVLLYLLENIQKIKYGYATIALLVVQNPPLMNCFNLILAQDSISRSFIKTVKINTGQCKDMLLYMLAYQIKIGFFYNFNKMKNKFLNDLLKNNFGMWLGYIESVSRKNKKLQKIKWSTLYLAIATLNFQVMKPPQQELTQYIIKIIQLLNQWQEYYTQNSKHEITKYGLKFTDLWKTKQAIICQLQSYLQQ